MTKEEAIKSLDEGLILRHESFFPEEFIYKRKDQLYDHKNLPLTPEFWFWKSTSSWHDGWSICKSKNE